MRDRPFALGERQQMVDVQLAPEQWNVGVMEYWKSAALSFHHSNVHRFNWFWLPRCRHVFRGNSRRAHRTLFVCVRLGTTPCRMEVVCRCSLQRSLWPCRNRSWPTSLPGKAVGVRRGLSVRRLLRACRDRSQPTTLSGKAVGVGPGLSVRHRAGSVQHPS